MRLDYQILLKPPSLTLVAGSAPDSGMQKILSFSLYVRLSNYNSARRAFWQENSCISLSKVCIDESLLFVTSDVCLIATLLLFLF